MRLETKSSQSVLIFGAGKAGEAAILKYQNSNNIIAILDNDPAKHNKEFFGYKVVSPSEIYHLTFDKVLIASEYFEQINEQLCNEFGVAQEKVQILDARDIKPLHFASSKSVKLHAEAVLATVSIFFIENQLVHYVDAGTLLGIIRDGELIPWDDDIDFAVHVVELNRLLSLLPGLADLLEKETGFPWSFELLYSPVAYHAIAVGDIRAVKMHCALADAKLPAIDLFVKYIAGDCMYFTLASRGLKMPGHFIDNTSVKTFKNMDVVVPTEAEYYLSLHYGEDWRTPKRDWNLSMLNNATAYVSGNGSE